MERPTAPVCLGPKIFPGHGTFRFKPRNSQANGTSRSPLEAIRSHHHITEANRAVLLEVTPSLVREVILFFSDVETEPQRCYLIFPKSRPVEQDSTCPLPARYTQPDGRTCARVTCFLHKGNPGSPGSRASDHLRTPRPLGKARVTASSVGESPPAPGASRDPPLLDEGCLSKPHGAIFPNKGLPHAQRGDLDSVGSLACLACVSDKDPRVPRPPHPDNSPAWTATPS